MPRTKFPAFVGKGRALQGLVFIHRTCDREFKELWHYTAVGDCHIKLLSAILEFSRSFLLYFHTESSCFLSCKVLNPYQKSEVT